MFSLLFDKTMPIQSVGVIMKRFSASVLLLPVLLLNSVAQDVGTVTVSREALRVIRGYAVFQGVEGMKLRQGDILETAATGNQTQLEFSGGEIVALGPASKLLLFSPTGGSAELVLLSGWLKGETPVGRTFRYGSPLVTVTTKTNPSPKGNAVLLHVTGESAEVFVESGAALVGTVASSKDRIYFSRRAGKPVAAAERPAQDFIANMPKSFQVTLPSGLSRYRGKKAPEPRRDHDVSYDEIERWMTLSPGWRRGFVGRFKPRLEDRAFRQSIEEHLASLPEWDPILHPERHKTDPAATDPAKDPAPTTKSDSPSGRYLP